MQKMPRGAPPVKIKWTPGRAPVRQIFGVNLGKEKVQRTQLPKPFKGLNFRDKPPPQQKETVSPLRQKFDTLRHQLFTRDKPKQGILLNDLHITMKNMN